jgi:myo-inositol-1(or 4)-monophosphatase
VSWRYLACATEAVLRAGAIQRARYGQDIEIQHKGTIDLVTEVDRACETAVLEVLRAHFPEHDIVTEESVLERSGSRFLWFVDPLDGTTNFAHTTRSSAARSASRRTASRSRAPSTTR